MLKPSSFCRQNTLNLHRAQTGWNRSNLTILWVLQPVGDAVIVCIPWQQALLLQASLGRLSSEAGGRRLRSTYCVLIGRRKVPLPELPFRPRWMCEMNPAVGEMLRRWRGYLSSSSAEVHWFTSSIPSSLLLFLVMFWRTCGNALFKWVFVSPSRWLWHNQPWNKFAACCCFCFFPSVCTPILTTPAPPLLPQV